MSIQRLPCVAGGESWTSGVGLVSTRSTIGVGGSWYLRLVCATAGDSDMRIRAAVQGIVRERVVMGSGSLLGSVVELGILPLSRRREQEAPWIEGYQEMPGRAEARPYDARE